MDFIATKDPGLIPQVLAKILDSCINGVTLADPDQEDMPLVYANKAFETITGYTQEEVIGKNCRLLQGSDHDQKGVAQLKEALINNQQVEVTIRNYRKNGELFYNHLNVTPLFDPHGNVLYFLGVQYEVTDKINALKEIEELKAKLEILQKQLD